MNSQSHKRKSEYELCYKAIVIENVWYWNKDRHSNQ